MPRKISDGSIERQKVIVEAREREAERARRQTLTAQSETKRAQDEAEQARQTTAQTQVEADAARKREEDLQKQLADLQSKIKRTDRGLVLTLGDVLFEFNKAECGLEPCVTSIRWCRF